MRSQPPIRLLVLLTLSLLPLSLFACAGSAQPPEHADKHLIECGGPMAGKLAQRASELALQHAVTDEVSREQLEQMIVGEIKALAVDFAPDLLQCLVDKALQAHRPSIAILPSRTKDLVLKPDSRMTACAGFVPIERADVSSRPWHTLLAGARGVRS